jgi:DNA-binding MarR family transcriptional regulator
MPDHSLRRAAKRRSGLSLQSRNKRARIAPARSGDGGRGGLELKTLQAFRTLFGTARTFDADVRRIAGISGSMLWALSEIAEAGGISVNGLSECMALHQTTASNLVNALTERKLIRRARDAADQRIVRLFITTEGKRVLLRAPGPYPGLLVDALRNIDATQLARLHKSLELLLSMMRDTASSAAGETLLGE